MSLIAPEGNNRSRSQIDTSLKCIKRPFPLNGNDPLLDNWSYITWFNPLLQCSANRCRVKRSEIAIMCIKRILYSKDVCHSYSSSIILCRCVIITAKYIPVLDRLIWLDNEQQFTHLHLFQKTCYSI